MRSWSLAGCVLVLAYEDSNTRVWRVLEGALGEKLRLEAETLYPPVSASMPKHRAQNLLKDVGTTCSANGSILFESARDGDHIELSVRVPEAGTYQVTAGHVYAPDYGIVQWSLKGAPVGSKFDGFAPKVASGGVCALGRLELVAGANVLRASVAGANPQSKGSKMGIDYVELERVEKAEAKPRR